MKYKPNAYLVKENSSVYSVKVTIPPYMRSLLGIEQHSCVQLARPILGKPIIRDKIMHEFSLCVSNSSLSRKEIALSAS
jgi:hypothetical protein